MKRVGLHAFERVSCAPVPCACLAVCLPCRVPGLQSAEQLVVATVGKVDAKKRIEDATMRLVSANIVQCLGTMLDTVVF